MYCKDCHSCYKPCERRQGYELWHRYYLDIATAVAQKSKDPRTKVGCVIVNPDNHIVATGYNGTPPGYPESLSLWDSKEKHDYVVHAEMNALLNSTQYTKNCILYTTLSPCKECAKLICAAGISQVYYLEEREDPVTTKLFKGSEIKCEKIELD